MSEARRPASSESGPLGAGRKARVRAAGRGSVAPRRYTDAVVADFEKVMYERVTRLSEAGVELPTPGEMARLLEASLPDSPAELDPHVADVGPFYISDGAIRQLGGISKQAVDSRRRTWSILAMRTQDGTWLYPAWQFTGDGRVHDVLRSVLKALRGMDRWAAGVWLVSDHPDLGGRSPRQALRDGLQPEQVANLAARDRARLVA